MKSSSKTRTFILGVGGGLLGLCLCACIGFFVLARIAESDPSIQATGTARANARITGTAQAIAQATENARPTSTPLPPTATSTPEPTETLDPSITPPTSTPTPTPTKTATPIPETAGASEWLISEGRQIGVREVVWSYSSGFYRAESGKIFVSLYIVGINIGENEDTFNPRELGLVDGGGEVHGGLLVEPKEPEYSRCTVKPSGVCEGWWTSQVWDRPEVKDNLIFRWTPSLFAATQETPIIQK